MTTLKQLIYFTVNKLNSLQQIPFVFTTTESRLRYLKRLLCAFMFYTKSEPLKSTCDVYRQLSGDHDNLQCFEELQTICQRWFNFGQ